MNNEKHRKHNNTNEYFDWNENGCDCIPINNNIHITSETPTTYQYI